MGEKFDTPTGLTGSGSAAQAVDASASGQVATAEKPSTREKPGTGSDTKNEKGEKKPPDFSDSSGWSGYDRYPDGYIMGRIEDGTIYLRSPEGEVATWDKTYRDWADPETGQAKPENFGGGHAPGKG